jgi:hypothetical protein
MLQLHPLHYNSCFSSGNGNSRSIFVIYSNIDKQQRLVQSRLIQMLNLDGGDDAQQQCYIHTVVT